MTFSRYSHGKTVKGAYHCRFGVVEKGTTPGQNMKPVYIRGLELTGSVRKHIYLLYYPDKQHITFKCQSTRKSIRYPVSCRSRMEQQQSLSRKQTQICTSKNRGRTKPSPNYSKKDHNSIWEYLSPTYKVKSATSQPLKTTVLLLFKKEQILCVRLKD